MQHLQYHSHYTGIEWYVGIGVIDIWIDAPTACGQGSLHIKVFRLQTHHRQTERRSSSQCLLCIHSFINTFIHSFVLCVSKMLRSRWPNQPALVPRVHPGRPKRRQKNLLRSNNVCLFVQRRWIIIAGCGFSPHRGALLFHLRKSFSLETASARQAIKAFLFPPVCSEEISNPGGEGELQVLDA